MIIYHNLSEKRAFLISRRVGYGAYECLEDGKLPRDEEQPDETAAVPYPRPLPRPFVATNERRIE